MENIWTAFTSVLTRSFFKSTISLAYFFFPENISYIE